MSHPVPLAPIVFIALDEGMLDLARATLRGRHDDVRLAVGLMGGAVEVARGLLPAGIEVAISRGASAAMLARALPDLSVVDISTSGLDLMNAIHRARMHADRLAVVAFPPMSTGAAQIGATLGVDVRVHEVAHEEEMEERIRAAVAAGAQRIVGGYVAVRAAQRIGVPCDAVETLPQSILAAVEEAKRIVRARAIEKAKASLLRAVLTFTDNGIVAVDGAGLVTVMNPIAGRLLRIGEGDALGQPVAAIWPRLGLGRVLATGQSELRQIDRVLDVDIICDKVAIVVGGAVVGAVVTFQDVRQIQRMEATVRRRILATGHVATARFADIVGTSAALRAALRTAADFAATPSTVLIQGETGTGKELFAQGLHNASARHDGPFVAVNCAALPGQLLESELFGYVPGAFTGASSKGKPGLFELAHGGTIFLDEIAEMDRGTQGKLLRVLQEKKVMRLGSDQVIPVDVRVVAATNKDLHRLVGEGAFRDDLYYRLNVLLLRLPPLRERVEDVALLARTFLGAQALAQRHPTLLAPAALRELERHPWPGNVRELQNVVARLAATVRCEVVDADDVRQALGDPPLAPADARPPAPADDIAQALAASHGRIAEAAKRLGISRSTLWRRMRERAAA